LDGVFFFFVEKFYKNCNFFYDLRISIVRSRKGGIQLEDILTRLKYQDETALQYIMDQYGNDLVRSAYLMVKDHQLAEEVVQDGFVKVFEKAHQIKDETKLKSWLMSVVLNQCRSKMRTKRFRLPFIPFDPLNREVEEIEQETPEALYEKMLETDELVSYIHRLNHSYREVVILFYFQDYSIEEMVEITNIKESTLKSRLRRARLKLRHEIEKGDVGIG